MNNQKVVPTSNEIRQEAIKFVKENWCDYSDADGGWEASEGFQCYLEGYQQALKKMESIMKNLTNVGER